MKKILLVFLLTFFQVTYGISQIPEILTIVEILIGKPNSYKIKFENTANNYQVIYGKKVEKVIYSEIKNSLNRVVVEDEDKKYATYLIKQIGNNDYLFMEIRFIDSLKEAKLCLPDEKLFNLAFSNDGITPYLKRPELVNFSNQDALSFLSYQQNTFKALKNLSEYLFLNTALKNSFESSKDIYAAFRNKIQDNAYLKWLYYKGHHGGSYMTLGFKLMESILEKDISAKITQYSNEEAAFFK
jgi:hypothetical protein